MVVVFFSSFLGYFILVTLTGRLTSIGDTGVNEIDFLFASPPFLLH